MHSAGKSTFGAPWESITAESVALLWHKAPGAPSYRLYQDGALLAETTATAHTAEGLRPDTEYAFRLTAVRDGAEMEHGALVVRTRLEPTVLSIEDFGAVGDGHTLNTRAIQACIDACPPGGGVCVPEGVYVTGALFLHGGMTLHLRADATLLGSGELRDFPVMCYRFEGLQTDCYASLINTKEGAHQNITIAGPGTLDANGAALRKLQLAENRGKPGRAICIRNTEGVYLRDVTVRQSPAWCVHIIYCDNVSLDRVRVHTKYDAQGNCYDGIVNGDGFDPDSCRHVRVYGCAFATGDDCIAIKSGRDEEGRAVARPTEDVLVTDCAFDSGLGIAVGSEMSGSVRDVLVRDCVFRDTFSIASVKAPRGRGAVVERVRYENCTLVNTDTGHRDGRWFRGAVNVDMFYSHDEVDIHTPLPVDDGTPCFRHITFENITVDTVGGNAIYLSGLPERHLEDIRLVNVMARGRYGMKAYNVDGLYMENVEVRAQEGAPYAFENVSMKEG